MIIRGKISSDREMPRPRPKTDEEYQKEGFRVQSFEEAAHSVGDIKNKPQEFYLKNIEVASDGLWKARPEVYLTNPGEDCLKVIDAKSYQELEQNYSELQRKLCIVLTELNKLSKDQSELGQGMDQLIKHISEIGKKP